MACAGGLVASPLGPEISRFSRRFDWFTKLVNLQAWHPSRDAGTLGFAALLVFDMGAKQLRSLV
ncbi:hypothetical protein SCOR_09875 [Sulfidibacter corallicola]